MAVQPGSQERARRLPAAPAVPGRSVIQGVAGAAVGATAR
ncbi:Hypothetical protein SCLAV_0697 [Streptomyces clavuligerus]|uniref:Uncharacterized protein n=1 Tax=Streptomyces clavuligerus TaxID=1901 RepID=E2PV26_STRCL|nr:Hypothetical protein SCLAV_0697 [Streptomyces clavuligerus]